MPFSPRTRWMLVPLALIPVAALRAGVLAESDTYWQIRVGLDILRTHRIPDVDRYSWTAFGAEWHPNSWLFDVGLAAAYRMGGLIAVAVAAAAFIPLIAAAVALLARRLGARPGPTVLLLLAGLTPMVQWLSARPQIVDYLAVVLVVLLTDIAMAADRRRSRWLAVGALGLLQALWVNLHLAATVGVAIAAIGVAAHLWRRRSAREAGFGAAVVLTSTLGTVLNPFGVRAFAMGLRVRENSAVITEWRPLDAADHLSQALLAVAVLGGAVAWRRGWLPVAMTVALLTIAGIFTVRLLPYAAVIGLSALAAGARTPRVDAYLRSRRTLVALAIAALLLAQSIVAIRETVGGQRRTRYPTAAILALPSGCRLFNSYKLGGPVILLRPDIPVSQDSRSDLYGTAAIVAARAVEVKPDGRAELAESGVTCVLTQPDLPLAADLARDPGWTTLGGDQYATAFVRKG